MIKRMSNAGASMATALVALGLCMTANADTRDDYISIKSDIAKMSRSLKPRLQMAIQNTNLPAVCAVILTEEIEALSKMNVGLKSNSKTGFTTAFKDAELSMSDLVRAGCASSGSIEKFQQNLKTIGSDFNAYTKLKQQGAAK